MKMICLRGGAPYHIVRSVDTATVSTECGRSSGQFASVTEVRDLSTVRICKWCRTTYNAYHRNNPV